MKAYLITTAAVFGLLTLAHILRAVQEGSSLASSPWFILLTLASAVLCAWALLLLRRLAPPRDQAER
jgi:drug/metabolite transporter (DMT)-like permease